jgi:hypothetical protein
MRGPRRWKAMLEGAKRVPPMWALVSLRGSKRPVLTRPSSRVLKSPGRKEMMSTALGGGMRMESIPWMTPLVAKASRAIIRA